MPIRLPPQTSTCASGWDSVSVAYDDVIGKVTRKVALRLISNLNSLSPFDTLGSSVFDNGCGTGAVTQQLAMLYPNVPILATDISPDMVKILAKAGQEQGLSHVRTMVQDAMALKTIGDSTFSHTVSVAVIGTTPSPFKVAKEMYRVTRSGGYAGITSFACQMWRPIWTEAVRKATGIKDYEAPSLQDPTATSVDALTRTLADAGWEVLDCHEEEAPFVFEDGVTPESFVFRGKNPIKDNLFKGLEDKLDIIMPIWTEVFQRRYPRQEDFHDTAIVAICRKP